MSGKSDPRNKTFTQARKAYKAWLGGHSFVPHTAELLNSPAWRYRSLYAMRFIDRLELEHTRHNGLENGYLKFTRRQMQQAGIQSRGIEATIEEVEALGLVTITHRGAYRGGARNDPNTYRLNYLPWKFVPAAGAPVYYAPTDEWAKYIGKSARPKIVRIGAAVTPYSTATVNPLDAASEGAISADPDKSGDSQNGFTVDIPSSIPRSNKRARHTAPACPPPLDTTGPFPLSPQLSLPARFRQNLVWNAREKSAETANSTKDTAIPERGATRARIAGCRR